MKKLILLLCLLLLPAVLPATPVTVGLVDYAGYDPSTELAWQAGVMRWWVGGSDNNTLYPGVKSSKYIDSLQTVPYDPSNPLGIGLSRVMKDWCIANSYTYEKAWLHATADYTHASGNNDSMSGTDNFGFMDDAGIHGIYLGSGYTDKTTALYTGGSGGVTLNNTLYIGYEEPFDQANFVFSTYAVGLSGTWQYWNGSAWATLTVTDGTSGMTASGKLYFVPPSTWAPQVLSGSRNKYWIRFNYTSSTTPAVCTTILAKKWTTGTNSGMMGWSSTDSHIVNSGALTYNPTPPTGTASANFPYQARIVGNWAAQEFIKNPNYIVSGHRVIYLEMAQDLYNYQQIIPYCTGAMFDDMTSSPLDSGIAADNTDYGASETQWWADCPAKFAELSSDVHTKMSSSFLVGGNISAPNAGGPAPLWSITDSVDWSLSEYFGLAYSIRPAVLSYPANSGGSSSYYGFGADDYATTGKTGFLVFADTTGGSFSAPGDGGNVPWDQVNRGPIECLATFLIGWNPNLVFAYTTTGEYSYPYDDQAFMSDGSTWHQSIQGVAPISTSSANYTTGGPLVTHYGAYFPAESVDFGTPTNARNVAWVLSATIGAGPGDSWEGSPDGVGDVAMRMWSNAIVLLRTADAGTYAVSYNTYSSAISLGGTYYPLLSDGTTGAPVTSVQLRHGEGFIGMTSPLGSSTAGPAVSILAPTGNLAAGTTSTPLTISAVGINGTVSGCKYAGADEAYASMSNTLTFTSGNQYSATISGLTNGSSTTEYVRCIDSAGNADSYSTPATITVNNPGTTYAPYAPTGITLTSGNGRITVSWTASATDGSHSAPASYTIDYGTSSPPTTPITSATSGQIITGLTNGTLEYVSVTAINSAGSAASSIGSATPVSGGGGGGKNTVWGSGAGKNGAISPAGKTVILQ